MIDFLCQAPPTDPTCSRSSRRSTAPSTDSPVVDALLAAARAGKEVTVVIELRARFDEAANIELATRLQEAGAQRRCTASSATRRTPRLILVVRREHGRLRRYVPPRHRQLPPEHGPRRTPTTASSAATSAIGEDVHELFLQLTEPRRASPRRASVLQSPFTLHERMLERTRREIDHARARRPARIVAKMNALIEPQIIQALYAASHGGREGRSDRARRCAALTPGRAGRVATTSRVRSIVGRFLEHSRVFYFENGGDPRCYCASADWMERNFFPPDRGRLPGTATPSPPAAVRGPGALPGG